MYIKMGQRRALAIAIVSVAVVYEPGAGAVRIALGSVAPTPLRATAAERRFASLWEDETDRDGVIEEVAGLAAEAVSPIDDVRATADYRRELTAVLVRRALCAACM